MNTELNSLINPLTLSDRQDYCIVSEKCCKIILYSSYDLSCWNESYFPMEKKTGIIHWILYRSERVNAFSTHFSKLRVGCVGRLCKCGVKKTINHTLYVELLAWCRTIIHLLFFVSRNQFLNVNSRLHLNLFSFRKQSFSIEYSTSLCSRFQYMNKSN